MELKLENKKVLLLEIEADMNTGYDEITHFLSAMDKIQKQASKAGFQRTFTKNERVVLQGLWDHLKPYATNKEGNN